MLEPWIVAALQAWVWRGKYSSMGMDGLGETSQRSVAWAKIGVLPCAISLSTMGCPFGKQDILYGGLPSNICESSG